MLALVLGWCFTAAAGIEPLGPARAQDLLRGQHDSSLPIEITADSMEWLSEDRLAIARGNADAIQGAYHLRADTLIAHLEEDSDGALTQIKRIDADGEVFLSSPGETAQGSAGVYDVTQQVITLTGSVVLTRDDSVIRGERLVLNLSTGKSRVEGVAVDAAGASEDGRVRALFVPESAKPGAEERGK